jgi:hypothetical protein
MPNIPALISSMSDGTNLFAPTPTLEFSTTVIPIPPPTLVSGTAGLPGAVYTVSVPVSQLNKLQLQGIYNVSVKFSVTTTREGAAGDILSFGIVGGTQSGPTLIRDSDFVTTFNLIQTNGTVANYTTNSTLFGAPPVVWVVFNYTTSGTPFAYDADITFVGYMRTGFIPASETGLVP